MCAECGIYIIHVLSPDEGKSVRWLIQTGFPAGPGPWKAERIWRDSRKRQRIPGREREHEPHFTQTNNPLMKSKQLEIVKALIIVGLYWNSHKRTSFPGKL